MAKILHRKVLQNQKVKCLVELQQEEQEQLFGRMVDIHPFHESGFTEESTVLSCGIQGNTKFFEVPQRLLHRVAKPGRGRKHLHAEKKISCQRIDKDGKSYFIYCLKKP